MYGVPPSVQFSVPVEETPSCGSVDMVGLEIGDTTKVLDYYERSLKHFQQLNCRQIAKAFIKFIEPGKQVKHPYNGGKPPAGAPPGKKGDPEKTKPEWWPADVVHKEPDHLRKDRTCTPPENLHCHVILLTDLERLSLLIHIIRKLGRFGITTDQLQEIAHDCKRQLRGPHRLQILDEVFGVRRIEERYERGEVGKRHLLSVKFILTAVDEPQMPTRSYMLSTESRTRKRRMATPMWIRTRSMSKKTIMRMRHFPFSTLR
jgi:hypothetical protein